MLFLRDLMLDWESLDSKTGYQKALAIFKELYLTKPVFDVLGRRIVFDLEDCLHISFKQSSKERDPYGKLPRNRWEPERAARIPWIMHALCSQETRIRPSPVRQDEKRESYVLLVPADTKRGMPQEFFGVFVRPLGNPNTFKFLTAYSLDQNSLNKVKNAGPLIHPAKHPEKK